MSNDWVEEILRRFKGRIKKDEIQLQECPYCGNAKCNFELNVNKMVFHCWVCSSHGTARGFFFDFNLPVDMLPRTTFGRREKTEKEQQEVKIPAEAVPILSSASPGAYMPIRYLENRGFDKQDIAGYGLLYAETGKYRHRVIWPMYMDGKLVYFVARRYMRSAGRAYDYPEVRRRNLVCVYPGTEKRLTLVLVEGVFQVPSVRALGYSVMPLLGTAVTPEQRRQLTKMNFERYVFLLDHDAYGKSISLASEFSKNGMDAMWTTTGGPDTDEMSAQELQVVVDLAQKPGVESALRAQMRR
jgi:DNA primase